MPGIETKDTCTLLPNIDTHSCFGCSPNNPSGMGMEFYINKHKDKVLSWYTVPDHLCGWGNVVHGGIVCTLLDEAMGWACVCILEKFLLSKSLNAQFLKPIYTGKEITVVGEIAKVNSDKEAVLQGAIYKENGKMCASSTSLASLYSPEALKNKGVID